MRKLATIRYIDLVRPIPKADNIEKVIIGGWPVVIKKGEYFAGDVVIYLEVDSWVPHELAPFLSKGKKPSIYKGIEGERLKTIRLRGQLSQGLVLPLSALSKEKLFQLPKRSRLDLANENYDVTEILGIEKWEPQLPTILSGQSKGAFPAEIPKTDQERIQNLKENLSLWKKHSPFFELTEKLDGASCTFYLDKEDNFHVCSRNINLREDDKNAFWKMARELDIERKLRAHNFQGYALQGELIGPSIQGNSYKRAALEFHLFDIYVVDMGYVDRGALDFLARSLDVPVVPRMCFMDLGAFESVEDILTFSEGKSFLNPQTEREGLVWRHTNNPDIHFKAISNKWLLKNQ